MSEQLKAFYKAYAAWLDAGAPQCFPFKRHEGLCYNLRKWSDCNEELSGELLDQFVDADLDWEYPFDGNWDNYSGDDYKHLNPARVSWVRKHAALARRRKKDDTN